MIQYKENIEFNKKELSSLFLSAEWNSGKYPDKLYESIKNSTYHIFAYDNDKLVGLISGLSDCNINLFISYLVVLPEYQKQGIGTQLLKKVISKKRFHRIQLITEVKDKEFYTKNGFIEDGIGMFKIHW